MVDDAFEMDPRIIIYANEKAAMPTFSNEHYGRHKLPYLLVGSKFAILNLSTGLFIGPNGYGKTLLLFKAIFTLL